MPRRSRAVLASVVVFALAAASVNAIASAASRPASRRQVTALPDLAAGIVGQINAARAEHRLAPLRLSRPLGRAAVSHTADMAVRGFFSHRSHEGTPAWLRLTRFYPSAGFRRWRIGEALLSQTGALSPGPPFATGSRAPSTVPSCWRRASARSASRRCTRPGPGASSTA